MSILAELSGNDWVNIIGAFAAILLAYYQFVMWKQLHKQGVSLENQDIKLDANATVLDEVKIMGNSQYAAVLLQAVVLTEKIDRDSPTKDTKAALRLAKKIYDDHMANQAEADENTAIARR